MKEEILIRRLEEEISNLESMKFYFNERLQDAIDRNKKLRFEIKYPNSSMLEKV